MHRARAEYGSDQASLGLIRRKFCTDRLWDFLTCVFAGGLVWATYHVAQARYQRGLAVKSLMDELQNDPEDYLT